MEEVKYLDVTERILRESVKEVNGELERRQVVDGVFNLLRRNRQLGRRVGMFDAEVKKAISGLLSKVLGDYGTGED